MQRNPNDSRGTLPHLTTRTVHVELRAHVPPPLHAYVHFPWCLEKCPYCDFVSFKTERAAIDHAGYADAVIREIHLRTAAGEPFGGHELTTVFLGGGTPSLWEPSAIARVLEALLAAFPHAASGVEITAECNPTSLDEARARDLVAAGVNRLSVGVQSLDAKQLKFLGRLHDIEGARTSLQAALRSGARVSADLIFGLPDQSPEEAARHAGELADEGLEHLSAYALTIEPGTRFGELSRRGKLPIAPEDATCDAFLAIEATLGARGLRHYEVSNYARPGCEARHNLGYWHGAAYVGLGCAAYGFGFDEGSPRRGVRYRDDPDPARYVEATRHSLAEVTVTREPLDAETLLRERIMLGLRLADGLDLGAQARELGLAREDVFTAERTREVEKLVREGTLEREGDVVRIPPARRLATDGVAARLF